MVGRPARRSGSGRESLPEALKWSGGPPKGLGVFGRSFGRSGSGRKALPEVQQWSQGSPGGPRVSGQEVLQEGQECQEWLEGPPEGHAVVERPSRRF